MHPADHDGGPSCADGRPHREDDDDGAGDHAAEHADDGAPTHGGAPTSVLGPPERSQDREVCPLPAHLTGDGLADEDQRRQPRQHGEGQCRVGLVGERVSEGLAIVGVRSGLDVEHTPGERGLDRGSSGVGVGGLDRDPGEAEKRLVLDRSPDCRARQQERSDIAPVEGRQVGPSPHDAHDLQGELRARGRGITLVLPGQEPAHVERSPSLAPLVRAAASLITVSSRASGSANRPSITTGRPPGVTTPGSPAARKLIRSIWPSWSRGPEVGELVGEAVSAHDLR